VVRQLRPAVPTHCPRCGAPVIRSARGELLEREPHPLAIDRPDGRKLTPREAAAAATGRTPPAGHHVHIEAAGYACRPIAQLALFTA
jgi:hypothetical protein